MPGVLREYWNGGFTKYIECTFSYKGLGFPNDASVRERHPYFKFHIVSPDKTNKNKKSIVGLYLGPNNL